MDDIDDDDDDFTYDPTKIFFGPSHNLEQIEENINYIINRTVTREEGEEDDEYGIRINKYTYAIQFDFKGEYAILLLTIYDDDDNEGFLFTIVDDKKNIFLNFAIYYAELEPGDDPELVGEILDARAPKHESSFISKKKHVVKWMIEMVDQIFCSFGVKTRRIQNTYKYCKSSDTYFLRNMLRVFQGKYYYPWYGADKNFGYTPEFKSYAVRTKYRNYKSKNFIEDVERLNSITMFEIQTWFENYNEPLMDLPPRIKDEIMKELLTVKPIINSARESFLSEFMSALWKKDCSQYIIVEEFLRKTSQARVDPGRDIFPWSDTFERIDYVLHFHSKKEKCKQKRNV